MRKTRKANLRKSRRKNQSGGKRSGYEQSGSEQSGGGFWDRIKSEVKSIFTLGASTPEVKNNLTAKIGQIYNQVPNSPVPPPPPPANIGRANALVEPPSNVRPNVALRVEPPPRETNMPLLPRSLNNNMSNFKTARSNNINLNEYNLANVPLSNNNSRRSRASSMENIPLTNNEGYEQNPFYRAPNANRLRVRGGSRRRRSTKRRYRKH